MSQRLQQTLHTSEDTQTLKGSQFLNFSGKFKLKLQ